MGEIVRLPGWEKRTEELFRAAERNDFRASATNLEWKVMEMAAWLEQSEALREEKNSRKPVL